MRDATTIRTTCPRDCYDACGITVRIAKDGTVNVVGDPDHNVSRGALCGKCSIGYNGIWRDESARLARPLRRIGPKGSGRFQPVSWEEALGAIANRLNAIRAEDGGSAILHTHYTGTCSLLAGTFPLRFFNRIGATEVDPDTVCNKAGHVALQLMYGESTRGFDPRTIDGANSVMIWGANPSTSAPHIDQYWLGETDIPKIVIDPIRHETAAAADIHLQLYPGTDGALAFAMLNVILEAGRIDRAFLAEHALGWEEVECQLAACTPSWGEAVTGVPARLIEEAARLYAEGPSLLWMGQGFQRQTFGGNAMRAVALLPAATGNLGRYGAGFLYLNGWDTRGIDAAYLTAAHMKPSSAKTISHMDLASRLESPETKAIITWNNNIAVSSPEQGRLRRALEREDLLQVTLDLFQTATANFADYVLPAASFLEFDDVVMSYFNASISAQVKAVPPIGESLPNQEIFRRLAAAMGLTDPELFESDAEMIGTLLGQAKPGLTFAALARVGTIDYPPTPIVQFERHDYRTPSGKIELAGSAFVAAGLPSAPFPSAEPRPAGGELRLLSPASKWLMNSSFGNDPKILRQLGEDEALMHPDEANARGLSQGTRVKLGNATGTLTLRLSLSADVPKGVLVAYKSRWTVNGAVNVNALNPGRKADLAESCAVHSINVSVAPV
ncbi:molybdopterin-containing oxidoreductase family protein [Methyloceanibacter sp.]|uniref:molybdopterin-containing oxidoreductase family protein n=1 Tax=Methyloceanibacter sp. TaxID=1965321 RepID=UPI002D50B7F0|nr:molybdopterin-dependent oxidoreductase [Methyloceanibacter sp.]HZP08165.1 molybdopterin-dependent oxidoreductase [Methyloceanibacter sp.]